MSKEKDYVTLYPYKRAKRRADMDGFFTEPEWYTSNTRPRSVGEINSGEKIVDDIGVMTTKQKVESMFRAGVNLQQVRSEFYDFGPGQEDNGFNDPSRTRGYDIVDGARDLAAVNERIATAEAEQSDTDPGAGTEEANVEVVEEPSEG